MTAHDAGQHLLLATSGTRGRPDVVHRTTRSWFDSFPAVARLTDLGPDSRVWVPGPLAGTMNLFAAVLSRWVGAEVVHNRGCASHAHLTPTALRALVAEDRDLSGLSVTVAGDRLPRVLQESAVAMGARVRHYYGAAELSFVGWGGHEEDLRAFPGVDVVAREGVLWARSSYLAEVRRDEQGYATVGDRGSVDERGRITVIGRGDTAVLTGGATVHVADVEAALRACTPFDLVVVGLPHEDLGQVVAAVLFGAPSRSEVAAVRAAARTTLPASHRPRRWFVVEDLPVTPAGKPDRAALRGLAMSGALRRVDPVGR